MSSPYSFNTEVFQNIPRGLGMSTCINSFQYTNQQGANAIYYNKSTGGLKTEALKDFHNLFVKKWLIKNISKKGDILIDFAKRFQTDIYLQILEDFIEGNGYDLVRVKLLVSLIYLNMSPLHNYPFDKLLYSLGRLTLNHEIQNL